LFQLPRTQQILWQQAPKPKPPKMSWVILQLCRGDEYFSSKNARLSLL
jgi:hypothetical protein